MRISINNVSSLDLVSFNPPTDYPYPASSKTGVRRPRSTPAQPIVLPKQKTLHSFLSLSSPPPFSQAKETDTWGHIMDGINILETFRVLLQNPTGIQPGRQDLEFQYSLSKCHALGIGAISLVETKLNWNNNTSSSASRQFATTWNFPSLSSSHG